MSGERIGWTLPLWVAASVLLFWVAPRPPETAGITQDELAAQQRAVDFVVRDTKAWQLKHGDQTIPWEDAEGHLAIVIDDVGRELHLLETLIALRYRLTFSVLPGSVYAAGAQLRLDADRRRYREVLLHLPMEPLEATAMHEGDEAREDFLQAGDDAAALRRKTIAALQNVPHAVGVNNHMGSKLTADRAAMDAIMPTLREAGVFFLDSRTDARTQAANAARSAGVPTLSRQVFLDHDPSAAAIAAQLAEAARLSKDAPTVAIGHPSAAMVEVLKAELPALLEQGVAIYPLSHVLARLSVDEGPNTTAMTPTPQP